MQDTRDTIRAANRRVVLLCGLASATLTVAFAVYRPAFLAQMDDRVYDALVRSTPAAEPDKRIVIVDVDERSLSAVGQWPWRRDQIAQLITRVRELGAAVVALDIIFAEPDRYETSGRASEESSPDAAFAEALAGGRVILGYAFTFDRSQAHGADCVLHPLSLPILHAPGGTVESPIFHASGAICSLPPLAKAAGASGFLNAVPDADGTLRRVPVLIEFQGRIYPSLALAAMMAASGSHAIALRAANANASSLMMNDVEVPLDGLSNLLLRYRGRTRSFRHVSAADILQGHTPAGSFSNAVVFVGATALGTREIVATPLTSQFTGVEVQATVADNLLQGDFASRPEDALILETFAILIVGIAVTLLIARFGLLFGSLSALVALIGMWAGSRMLLSIRGEYLSPLFPSLGLAASLAGATIAKLTQERGRADRASTEKDLAQRLMVQSLLSLTETRDAETGRHSRRTRQYTRLLAEQLSANPSYHEYLTPVCIDLLATLAPLHDIGKVGVPDQLLNKPGELTPEEFREMQKHPVYGLDVITRAERDAGAHDDEILEMAKDIVYTHHERWDGKGYPRGLKGEQIPVAGRLIALVDVYDAMTTRRLYRQPLSHEQAVQRIVDAKGTHFDPAVVDAFIRVAPLIRELSSDVQYTPGGVTT
ncbi:MAG TPA: CHASE2 domain-containing protein [Vicinamibacterales bacterium]